MPYVKASSPFEGAGQGEGFLKNREGVLINYNIQGEGSPILFLHGWGMSSRVWKYQIEHFSKKYKTVTVDFRGHGSSDSSVDYTFEALARDVKELVERLSLGRVSIVGWSMGGYAAMEVADKYPEIVSTLVFVSTTPKFVESEDFRYGQTEGMVKLLSRQLESDLNRAMMKFCGLMFDEEGITEEVWKLISTGPWPDKETLQGYLKILAESDYRNVLKKILVPTLIVHGKLDQISFHDAAVFMAGQIKIVRLETHHDEGHAPFLTRPGWFNAEMEAFLKEFVINLD